MKTLFILLSTSLLIGSCTHPKIKPQPETSFVCEYHKQYEKFFQLATKENLAIIAQQYGSSLVSQMFVVSNDTIWSIYQSDPSIVEYLPCTTDTVTYTYFDAVGTIDERFLYIKH